MADEDIVWLTTRDVAQRWKKSVAAIHEDRYRGVGPKAYRLGRSLRFKLEDVVAYEESRVASSRAAS